MTKVFRFSIFVCLISVFDLGFINMISVFELRLDFLISFFNSCFSYCYFIISFFLFYFFGFLNQCYQFWLFCNICVINFYFYFGFVVHQISCIKFLFLLLINSAISVILIIKSVLFVICFISIFIHFKIQQVIYFIIWINASERNHTKLYQLLI